MPELLDEAFAAVGLVARRPGRADPAGPRLPRALRRRQHDRRAHRRRRHGGRGPPGRRPGGSGGLPAAAGLAHRPVPAAARHVHRRQLRLAVRPCRPRSSRTAGRDRRVRQARPADRPVPRRRAAAAAVLVPVAVRGPRAGRGARRVRRDRLHGHRRRRVVPERWGRRGRRGNGRRRRPTRARRSDYRTGAAWLERSGDRVTRRPHHARRADPVRRGRAHPGPAGELPAARHHAAPAAAAALVAVGGGAARRRDPHVAGARAPHGVLRRGTGTARSTRSCTKAG